ncbi:MAG TPA: META domain-containing protein [Vicinamibacteria bacterium]|nr:META domain-containing protein [Vicinamibacteria bacterium]
MSRPSHRKPRPISVFGAIAIAVLALVSCSDGVTGPSDLTGGVWRLSSMRLAGATSSFVPDDASRFTVEFGPDGVIGVRADCNSCGGTYSLRGDRLDVPGMACTLALCATPQGGEFANLIEGTATLDKDGEGRLQIASPDGIVTLVR